MARNFRINTFHDSLIETLHVLGCEWWIQSNQFVQYAAQRPYIRLQIIWLILPDFRTCVIWSSCLSFQNSGLSNFGNIQITQFHHSIFREENIGTFDISMNNLLIMKRFQPQHHLVEDRPDVCLLSKPRGLFSIVNFCLQVTVVTVFHHNT